MCKPRFLMEELENMNKELHGSDQYVGKIEKQ